MFLKILLSSLINDWHTTKVMMCQKLDQILMINTQVISRFCLTKRKNSNAYLGNTINQDEKYITDIKSKIASKV